MNLFIKTEHISCCRIVNLRKVVFVNPLSAKISPKVTLREHAPRFPASPSLITFQFHSLVVSLSNVKVVSYMPVIWYLKG